MEVGVGNLISECIQGEKCKISNTLRILKCFTLHCGPTDRLHQHIRRNSVLARRGGNDLLGRCILLKCEFWPKSCSHIEKASFKVAHIVLLFCFCTTLPWLSQDADFSLANSNDLSPSLGSLCLFLTSTLIFFLCSCASCMSCFLNIEYWAKKYPYFLLDLLWLWWKSSLLFPAFPFKHLFIGLDAALNLMVLLSI